jgi:hypothetical protein
MPGDDADHRFVHLVGMFQFAALQQMGKLVNPVTQEVERDLDQAKASIDILEMLQSKTEGNLTEAEREFLGKVLFELRMDYVDEVNRASKEPEKPPADGAGEEPGDEDRGDEKSGSSEGKTE